MPGFSKGDVLDYYARVAPVLIPHLRGRALTVVRFPDGVEGKHFFEKRCPKHRPDWVRTEPVWAGGRTGEIDFCVCDEPATLLWLAQLAALELHPSLAHAEDSKRPTVLALDLDPGPPATIVECCRVALIVRELFASHGVECFPKSSGSKGMQVYVPLNGRLTYETTKPYAKALAETLQSRYPDLVVSKMRKDLRGGKIFIDWSQNTETKTTVAPYSLRAREYPTVSTPLTWDEVSDASDAEDPALLRFTSERVLDRIDEHGDLFAPVLELEQGLPTIT